MSISWLFECVLAACLNPYKSTDAFYGTKSIICKAHATMHVMQSRWTNKTVTTVSADRQTHLGTAVYTYTCECSICSTVKYKRGYLHLFSFVKEVWEMETRETAVIWACRKYTSQSVKDDGRSNILDVTFIYQQRKLRHTLDRCLANRTQG